MNDSESIFPTSSGSGSSHFGAGKSSTDTASIDADTDQPCTDACGLTDVGRKRSENQDQFLIADLRKSMRIRASSLEIDDGSNRFGQPCGQLLMVADGMGGHAAGKKASSIAMEQLIMQLLNTVHWFLRCDEGGAEHEAAFVDSLKGILKQAHQEILLAAADDQSRQGMGTTLTMAYIVWPRMYVVHAGDSRCYLIRNGVCDQITTDHTLAHQLVKSGGLKPEEEQTSRWSNVLWNVLGGNGKNELTAEVRQVDLVPGDTVLLCSDGLSCYLSSESIAEVLSDSAADLGSICHRFVSLANAAGGQDNVTVVVSRPVVQTDEDDDDDLGKIQLSGLMEPSQFKDEETWPG